MACPGIARYFGVAGRERFALLVDDGLWRTPVRHGRSHQWTCWLTWAAVTHPIPNVAASPGFIPWGTTKHMSLSTAAYSAYDPSTLDHPPLTQPAIWSPILRGTLRFGPSLTIVPAKSQPRTSPGREILTACFQSVGFYPITDSIVNFILPWMSISARGDSWTTTDEHTWGAYFTLIRTWLSFKRGTGIWLIDSQSAWMWVVSSKDRRSCHFTLWHILHSESMLS